MKCVDNRSINKIRLVLISFFLILCLLTPSQNVSANDWPMFQQNVAHTGSAESNSSKTNQLAWFRALPVITSPSVSDNKIYACARGAIYCLDIADGHVIWEQYFYSSGEVSQSIEGNMVYVGFTNMSSRTVTINAYNKNTGAKIWMYNSPRYNQIVTSASLAISDGKILFPMVGLNSTLTALSQQTGATVWTIEMDSYATPAVENGTVYIGDNLGYLYALDMESGSEMWKSYVSEPAEHTGTLATPTIFRNKVMISSWDGSLTAFNKSSGEIIWKDNNAGCPYSSPAAFQDRVIATSRSGSIIAMKETDGSVLWSEHIPTYSYSLIGFESSPAISNGLAYIGYGTRIYALNLTSNGDIVWSYNTGRPVVSDPAIANDMVFLTAGGGIFAFKDTWCGRVPDLILSHIGISGDDGPGYYQPNTFYTENNYSIVDISLNILNNGEVPGQIENASLKIFNGLPENGGTLINETKIVIDPEGSNQYTIQWNTTCGNYTICAIVESDGVVENDVENNRLEMDVTIKSEENGNGSIDYSEDDDFSNNWKVIIFISSIATLLLLLLIKRKLLSSKD